jgi:hypothetical protein
MALHTIGTKAASSLVCAPAWSAVEAMADTAAISAAITPDEVFGALLSGYSAGATAVLGTSATHSNTVLDTLVATGGAALAQIHVGDLVLKADVPPGTFVASITSGTAVVLSQAASGSNAGRVAFVRRNKTQGIVGVDVQNGLVTIPGRGILKMRPGDVIAVDPATGWPVLVSAAAIAYAGSLWTFT